MTESENVPTRRSPFLGLERLGPWEPLGSTMGDLLADWPRRTRVSAPPVDITEAEDRYVIRAELAGCKKEDVAVELEEGLLTIRGEKRSRREENGEKGRHLECSYGAFSRSFTLPKDADDDQITAEFKDGVLEVVVSKRPESKPKQIVVNT